MTVSVIIPTVGRDSLQAAVASCASADEVVVVENQDGDHGYSARMRGMAQATGTHLAFLDDDDIYTDGAIDLMREAACDRPVIFRMDDPVHGIIWRQPVLEFGNVGTPMFLVPNERDLLGRWAAHAPGLEQPGGDFTFISGCVEQMGTPVWREEVVALVSPATKRLPSIAVVTPWLNHPELEDDYMAAVSPSLLANDELLVVDNGSDPELSYAAIRFDDNQGFNKACNAGLRAAQTDAVLFLNNDIAATRPDWLRRIREALEPGVLAGANLRYDRHANVDGWDLPYLDGWCLAGMTEDIRGLGGWDTSYEEPSYYGDNDLCFRARMAGMTLRQVEVGLNHLTNRTAGPVSDPRVRKATEANYMRFAAKVREGMAVAA